MADEPEIPKIADELEIPESADQLYRARGEVNPYRPLLQGDVFDGTPIPGVDEERSLAIITTHACDMRGGDGVSLADHLHAARVEKKAVVESMRGWFKYFPAEMPLPEMRGPGSANHTAQLDLVGRTESAELGNRIACLDDYGITILQQRLANRSTRVVISKDLFMEQSAPVFAEADLMEEWVEASDGAGTPREEAERQFHEFIRADRGGEPAPQKQLRDAAKRSHVRQVTRKEISARFLAGTG